MENRGGARREDGPTCGNVEARSFLVKPLELPLDLVLSMLLETCDFLASKGSPAKKGLPHLGRALTDVQEMKQAINSQTVQKHLRACPLKAVPENACWFRAKLG